MQSKLPFYRQEKPYSCVPACLRMVLAAKGYVVSESVLRERCVNVRDPLQGERLLPRSTFDTAWAMMRNLVILVQD
jgi:Peptidase_C39 like family